MFNFALKNILFYKGRSITTFILTFVSAMLFVVFVSWQDGSHNSMLENSLKIYTGAIEIYHKDYRDVGGNEYLIRDAKSITDKLLHVKGIEAFTTRYETYGLLSSKEHSGASMIAGIEPDKEKLLSSIAQALREGEFLDETNGNCLYMGSGLVKKLKLHVGDEVSFVGGASDDSFAADIFKVCGTFKTGSFEFDSSASFVNRSYFDELMYAKNMASYITIKVENLDDVDRVNSEIIKILDDENLESLTWKTLMKTMVEAMEVDNIFGYISLSLFLVVIFFVIMIYGFINVSSRIKEFGVLKCIGLSKQNIFLLLFYEIFILSSAAFVIAVPLASYICYYYSINPIVIEGIAEMYKDYGIVSDEIPFNFDMYTISWNIGLIYLLNFLSILYPYMYINSFGPIEASRHV
ncbi:FtsX-like permease family protein [Sulfurimonas sp.]|uniref:ABC transporter permease n=1 Tax=Sulfurimonas sp. TaxID=2022749 RepID=UPI00262CAEDE|nr:FtsX-like permease family protein [Sulfurimonas sp.]MCW8895611.1 FtsX-like permease family protein [Sulfurimonas sp.]MCW9067161.1 FtsX-like permease family protein [Sulfurimonas sp.]